ncbi:hypothetical protein [Edaphovirga cremea]
MRSLTDWLGASLLGATLSQANLAKSAIGQQAAAQLERDGLIGRQ